MAVEVAIEEVGEVAVGSAVEVAEAVVSFGGGAHCCCWDID